MKKSRLFKLALLLVCVLCVQTSRAQDDNPFSLPEGTRARLGKGAINGWWSPVAYSSDGTRLAVASDLGIWLYDAHTGTEFALLTDHTTRISSVAFAPDGKTIASAGFDQTIQLWDVASRTLKNTLEGHTDRVTSVAFAPDGQTLASASDDQTVRLWDVGSATLKNTLQGHTRGVSSVAFAPDGQTLASTSFDQTIQLWDVGSATLLDILEGYDHRGYSSVAFAPDGQTLASASDDQTVRLWDVETATLKNTLRGHTRKVTSVAFAPDGKTLASAGYDQTVRLWDVETATLKNTLERHADLVTSMAFAPDGKTLVGSSCTACRPGRLPTCARWSSSNKLYLLVQPRDRPDDNFAMARPRGRIRRSPFVSVASVLIPFHAARTANKSASCNTTRRRTGRPLSPDKSPPVFQATGASS